MKMNTGHEVKFSDTKLKHAKSVKRFGAPYLRSSSR